MASTANFVATPQWAGTVINTANTNRDGTGTITMLVTATATGARVDRVTITQTATISTATIVRLWQRTTAGTWRLRREIGVAAYTVSATAATPSYTVETPIGSLVPAFQLGPTDELGVSIHTADSVSVIAEFGDF